MEELKTKPRDYQENIFETCREKSCLVVLPTGTGKTLIAIMLAIERFKKFPLEKILILAPTRPLIEQHLESFKENLPDGWADMQLFTGKTQAEKRKKNSLKKREKPLLFRRNIFIYVNCYLFVL